MSFQAIFTVPLHILLKPVTWVKTFLTSPYIYPILVCLRLRWPTNTSLTEWYLAFDLYFLADYAWESLSPLLDPNAHLTTKDICAYVIGIEMQIIAILYLLWPMFQRKLYAFDAETILRCGRSFTAGSKSIFRKASEKFPWLSGMAEPIAIMIMFISSPESVRLLLLDRDWKIAVLRTGLGVLPFYLINSGYFDARTQTSRTFMIQSSFLIFSSLGSFIRMYSGHTGNIADLLGINLNIVALAYFQAVYQQCLPEYHPRVTALEELEPESRSDADTGDWVLLP
ncbi:MAG: hypothetical protein Q9183_005836 [Haloplaca sp. 2 TL-2023]